ncbi:MAG: hypothetical protein ABI947_09065 [Chloroflexota bacterium]
MEKAKRDSQKRTSFPFATMPLPFEFTVPLSHIECGTRLKKLAFVEPPSEVVLLLVDSETQRFHITTRALRSHLVETKGYFKQLGASSTQVKGEIYGDAFAMPLFAVVSVLVILGILLSGFNLLVVLGGVGVFMLVTAFCRSLSQRASADQHDLLHLLEDTLTMPNS